MKFDLISLVMGGLVIISTPGLKVLQNGSVHPTVEINHGMQELQAKTEDSDTGQLYVFPTWSPQVTAHSVFIQGSL